MNLTLKQLEYFNQIAKYESLSKAAKTLGITQPALSAALKKIEQSLDLQLFDRGRGRMTLTHAGRVLLPKITQLLSNYQKALKNAEKIAANQKRDTVSLLIPACPWTNTLKATLENDPRFSVVIPPAPAPAGAHAMHDCDVAITCHYQPPPELPGYHQAEILTVSGLSSVTLSKGLSTSRSTSQSDEHLPFVELLIPAESKLHGITQTLHKKLTEKIGSPEITVKEFQCFDSLVASCHGTSSIGILPGPARIWRSIYGNLFDIEDLDDFSNIQLTVCMTAVRGLPQTLFDELANLAKVSMRKLPPRKRLPRP